MQLTRAADYGVRVMMHLVCQASGTRASLTDLAEAADVSPAFLSKVLQRLVRAGLLASRRGKRGGFEMLEKGRQASLYDILEALDGLPALNVCLLDSGSCHRSPWCAAHPVWMAAQQRLLETLRETPIEGLAWDSHTKRLSMMPPAGAVQGQGPVRANGHGEGNGWCPVES